jgi:hypothetical protein
LFTSPKDVAAFVTEMRSLGAARVSVAGVVVEFDQNVASVPDSQPEASPAQPEAPEAIAARRAREKEELIYASS